jgi:Uma2 family endonuclease
MALREPRFVFEVSSPRTARIDTGRKVEEYLAIGTLEAYAFGDRKRRTITVYRPDTGPQTIDAGVVVLADALRLPLDDVFA